MKAIPLFFRPWRPRQGAMAGFTLIEMVVVVAIVGFLAMAAHPLLSLTLQRQKEFELRQNLRALRTAIDAYKQAAASGRIKVAADSSGYPPTLGALVDGVPDAQSGKDQRLYFLRRMPRDPFADPALPPVQTWGLRSHDSPPDAPRPGRDVFDVHSRADGIALDGSAYRDW